LTLALAVPLAGAQESKLPDIGSSAGELLTPARQAEYGGMMLRELRNYGYLLDDPLVDDWLQTMGARLGSNSAQPRTGRSMPSRPWAATSGSMRAWY